LAILVEQQKLSYLNILNLSFNHLYNEVPTGGVFNNVTTISLFGNKDLCGGIPQLKLPACSKLSLKKHKWSFRKKLILHPYNCRWSGFGYFNTIYQHIFVQEKTQNTIDFMVS